MRNRPRPRLAAATFVAIVGTVWIGAAWYMTLRDGGSPSAGAAESRTEQRPGARMPSDAETFLTLHGSNTIGAELAPALAEAYLRANGARDVRRIAGDTPMQSVVGTLPGRSAPQRIEIAAHGSNTGFAGLISGDADIAMASRPIQPGERDSLRDLGDLTSPDSEHVIALDGIAVIISNSLPVDALTLDQLRAIFTCEITDWSEVGGPTAPITVYARDDNSGTFDAFAEAVLGDAELCTAARRVRDSAELARRVSGDGAGIGFVGVPFAGDSKVLELSVADSTPLVPTPLTVGTDGYVLSRRLYLYTASSPAKPAVAEFTAFARSDEGQRVVAEAGFVEVVLSERTIETLQADAAAVVVPDDAPRAYVEFARGALRIPVDVRFEAGTDQLDDAGLRDVERIAQVLNDPRYDGREVLLGGFSDNRGDEQVNLGLSHSRAEAVAQEMRAQGIETVHVNGFGEVLPVDRNDTESGRAKNRRVEVWLR